MDTQPAAGADPRSFQSFAECYPFYLAEHSNRVCRRLHFIGDRAMYRDILLGKLNI
jgi:hypothetical protein